MITLTFEQPRLLKDHFEVMPDATPWNRTYIKTRHGTTPERGRATYQTVQRVLRPQTEIAHHLAEATGLYMLAFDLPSPALYVGIAAEAKRPEGILRRLQKHCVKAMGSNVGKFGSTGGVHHPSKWSDFAIQRHVFLNGTHDALADVRFITAQVNEGNEKTHLEHFEAILCSNLDRSLDQICAKLWEGGAAHNIRLLTDRFSRLRGAFDHRLLLW